MTGYDQIIVLKAYKINRIHVKACFFIVYPLKINYGKKVWGTLYVHVSNLDTLIFFCCLFALLVFVCSFVVIFSGCNVNGLLCYYLYIFWFDTSWEEPFILLLHPTFGHYLFSLLSLWSSRDEEIKAVRFANNNTFMTQWEMKEFDDLYIAFLFIFFDNLLTFHITTLLFYFWPKFFLSKKGQIRLQWWYF